MTRHDKGLAVAPLAVWLPVAAAGVWWPDGFYDLVAEDRVFEWLQVAAFAVAAGGCLAVAVAVRRRSVAAATFAALWCALFVVVVGEELAWGQRAFGVHVAALERVNEQGDVSLHNVGPGLTVSHLGILGVAMAGVLARPAARTLAARRGVTAPDGYLPPRFLTVWFGLAAAFTTVRLLYPSPPARLAKFTEVSELTVAVAAAITAVHLARALTGSDRSPRPAHGSVLSGR